MPNVYSWLLAKAVDEDVDEGVEKLVVVASGKIGRFLCSYFTFQPDATRLSLSRGSTRLFT